MLGRPVVPDGQGPGAPAEPALVLGVGRLPAQQVEQGRALEPLDRPLAVGRAIWPHGRWRMEFHGMADHAGTTTTVTVTCANPVFNRLQLQLNAGAVEDDQGQTNVKAESGVVRIDGTPVGTGAPGPITNQLRAAFEARLYALAAAAR